MTRALALLCFLLAAVVPRPLLAQAPPAPAVVAVAPPDVTQEITLRDGTRAVGRVERVAEAACSFRTLGGATLDVAAADVVAARDRGRARPPGASSGRPIPTRRGCSSGRRRGR